jgi:choline kinase
VDAVQLCCLRNVWGKNLTTERALILAAGRGVRMGPRGQKIPKGLIEVGGQTLIGRSLALLARAGIREAVIVTGHLAESYAEVRAPEGLQLSLQFNPQYAERGSFESLRVGLGAIEPPFLLLESDLIYEPRALDAVLRSRDGNIVLTSGPTGAGDEVYVWADGKAAENRLRDMSKARSAHADEPFGELAGILKVSADLASQLRQPGAETPGGDYESAMVAAARSVPVQCLRVDDLLWGEIDNEEMLARVQRQLWPLLQTTS